jgi:hypothetical protein
LAFGCLHTTQLFESASDVSHDLRMSLVTASRSKVCSRLEISSSKAVQPARVRNSGAWDCAMASYLPQ